MQLLRITITALLLAQSSGFTTPGSGRTQLGPVALNAEPETNTSTKTRPEAPAKRKQFQSNVTPQEEQQMAETFGGYTVKQRLREEVESPFRKIRFFFFASSTGSALTALYFSATNALKAYLGTYSDAMPLDEALTSCGINLGGAIVCGFLAVRDYNIGQANLERIARGGKLAKLAVAPAFEEKTVRTLADYRRNSRVLICAGGKEYIEDVCRSLNADQLSDVNTLPEAIEGADLIVVPVLLSSNTSVGDTKAAWRETTAGSAENSNFDVSRADNVVAFPWNNGPWMEYLTSEIETAEKQKFDVLSKGITLTVKKNGKILRRATGKPRWADLVGTMEVLDGSKFGMPGDSANYGGP
jgi:hypothetical protein